MSKSSGSERTFNALEAMLVHLHAKEDMHSMANIFRERFSTAAAFFGASTHLLEVCGLKHRDAVLASHITDIARYAAHAEYDDHPQVGCLQLASEYLLTNFMGLKVERFYMLCLNSRGRLMENIFLQEGTLDGTLFDIKRMLAEVVRVEPCAVVLSHNHPMGTLRPSQQDLICTEAAIHALGAIGVPLLDHVIFAGRTPVSIRENGFVPTFAWTNQFPQVSLIHKWLLPPKDPDVNNRKPPRRHK